MKKEQWRPVVGYEGHYVVSDQGNVASLKSRWGKRDAVPICTNVRKGYKRVSLSINSLVKQHAVHHLVLLAFGGPREPWAECDHKNGERGDNRIENLQWVTRKENQIRKAKRHGGFPWIAGEKNRLAKLNSRLVRVLRIAYQQEVFVISHVAKSLGVCDTSLGKAIRGTRWLHADAESDRYTGADRDTATTSPNPPLGWRGEGWKTS